MNPHPAAPDSARPHPAAPDSARPHPAAPDSARPHPAAPDSARPQPAAPDSARPHPNAPDSACPHPNAPVAACPQPPAPDSARPHPSAPGAARPQPAASDSARPHPNAPDSARPQPAALGNAHPHPAVPGAALPHPNAPDNARPHPPAPDSARPHPNARVAACPHPPAPDSARPHPNAPGAARPQPAASDSARPHPNAPDSARPHPNAPGAARPHPAAPDSARPHPNAPDNDLLLLIDTSTSFGAVALWRDNSLVRSLSWRSRNNHTAELLPAIDALLRAHAADPAALAGLIVTVGPGGFSAVRTGLGVAKGLALGGALPIVGISSLEASAYPYRNAAERICAVLPAGRGTVAWAAFSAAPDHWRPLAPETVSPIEDLIDAHTPETLLCGEAAPHISAAINERLQSNPRPIAPTPPRVVSTSAPLDRINGAGKLGADALASGRREPPAAIAPRYLRPPRITPSSKTAPILP